MVSHHNIQYVNIMASQCLDMTIGYLILSWVLDWAGISSIWISYFVSQVGHYVIYMDSSIDYKHCRGVVMTFLWRDLSYNPVDRKYGVSHIFWAIDIHVELQQRAPVRPIDQISTTVFQNERQQISQGMCTYPSVHNKFIVRAGVRSIALYAKCFP